MQYDSDIYLAFKFKFSTMLLYYVSIDDSIILNESWLQEQKQFSKSNSKVL